MPIERKLAAIMFTDIAGYKSNTYARRFGTKLVPEFYEKYNPIPTRKDAEELEEYVALNLRKERFGVWFN